MLLERILNAQREQPDKPIARFRDDQIAQRSTWAGIPDSELMAASMHVIRMTPANASTETILNPLDPASVGMEPNPDNNVWAEHDGGVGSVVPAGRGRW